MYASINTFELYPRCRMDNHAPQPQMAPDVKARARAANTTEKKSVKQRPENTDDVTAIKRSHSSEIAKRLHLKRADYPPDIIKLVMKLRAASYKLGGTDLAYLFGKLDKDKSGSLDLNEFKLTLRRWVNCGTDHRLHLCLE